MKRDFTMDDFRGEMQRRGVYETVPPPPLPKAPPKHASREHGNTVTKIVACGVHPLHSVKVCANGSRSGCPMCEMQIEALCRVPTTRPPELKRRTRQDHAPRITLDRPRIVGCTCGWVTPPGTADSEDAYVAHAAHAMVLR